MIKNKETSGEAAKGELLIIRVLNAPRELVFKTFTDPAHLEHWWGPKGLKTRVLKFDLRPGGIFHYSMESPDGNIMWGRFIYKEIVAPEKIIFINSFSDEQGNLVPVPFSKTWPKEMLNTWTLTEHAGKTTLTLRSIPINASAEEHNTFEEGFDSMRQGFGGTFDQLDEYLATLNK